MSIIRNRKSEEVSAHLERVAPIVRDLMILEGAKANLSSGEARAQRAVEEKIKATGNKLRELADPDHIKRIARQLPVVPEAVMTWRDDEGFPVLAPFCFDRPEFELKVEAGWVGSRAQNIKVTFPHKSHCKIVQLYWDVVAAMFRRSVADQNAKRKRIEHERCQPWKWISLKAVFNAFISFDARTSTAAFEATGDAFGFGDIFKLAHVRNWQLDEAVPTEPSFMVVGWDGEHFRLIAACTEVDAEQEIQNLLCSA